MKNYLYMGEIKTIQIYPDTYNTNFRIENTKQIYSSKSHHVLKKDAQ